VGETEGLPRRVAWRQHGTPSDPRAHIIAAASRCLAAVGLERTSLTAIANESGVSRQTIYNYFATRDEIIVEALEKEAAEASERIMAVARNNATAAGYVVELLVSAYSEFKRNPAISPVIAVLEGPAARARVLTPDVVATVRHFLEPILSYLPDRGSQLDEMTETYMRFLLSLLTFESAATRSQDSLRSYLHRVLVPALGLPADPV
jgi:AcrR family transcriptional regulator